jgi:hypothetical protein
MSYNFLPRLCTMFHVFPPTTGFCSTFLIIFAFDFIPISFFISPLDSAKKFSFPSWFDCGPCFWLFTSWNLSIHWNKNTITLRNYCQMQTFFVIPSVLIHLWDRDNMKSYPSFVWGLLPPPTPPKRRLLLNIRKCAHISYLLLWILPQVTVTDILPPATNRTWDLRRDNALVSGVAGHPVPLLRSFTAASSNFGFLPEFLWSEHN